MDELFSQLSKQALTLGPIGVCLLAGWGMWLKWGQKREATVDLGQAATWHVENRDTLRDTNERTKRMADMQEDELKSLADIASHQERTALILDRIDARMDRVDRLARFDDNPPRRRKR